MTMFRSVTKTNMEDFHIVTATVVLRLKKEQPVADWLPVHIELELDDTIGEQILEYSDNEPVVEQLFTNKSSEND